MSAPRAIYLRCELKVGIWDGLVWPSSYSDPINFVKIELTAPAQEKEELISNMTSSFGSAIDSQAKPTESAQGALEFNTFTDEMLATVLGADIDSGSQTADAVTDLVVDTVLDLWVPLTGVKYLDGEQAISLKTAADAAVDASAYEVDLINGMIKATDAAAVGTGMKFSATKAARSWTGFAAGQAKSTYLHLTGQATDKVTGRVGKLDIWKASLAPEGAVDPVAGGYFTGSLSGSLIAPTGKVSPWHWEP